MLGYLLLTYLQNNVLDDCSLISFAFIDCVAVT